MGWKSFKEYFGINHIVHIREDNLCIGSPFVTDLVKICTKTGKIAYESHWSDFLSEYYPSILKASTDKLLDLIKKEDVFENLKTFYTCEKGEILEKKAPSNEFPEVTTDGKLIYEGMLFSNKQEALLKAIRDCRSSIEITKDSIERVKNEVKRYEKRLREKDGELRKYSEMYEAEECYE
ncbi:MAG: hypothetical protein GY909_16180 [Oligoflexia bacterium]|nr:hypothetical protein [Oligoflexia bacterium]